MPAADSRIGFERRTKEFDPCLRLKALYLMAERTLRDVQTIGSTRQAALVMDGFDGAQVTELDMHRCLMKILSIMNLSHHLCPWHNVNDPIRSLLYV